MASSRLQNDRQVWKSSNRCRVDAERYARNADRTAYRRGVSPSVTPLFELTPNFSPLLSSVWQMRRHIPKEHKELARDMIVLHHLDYETVSRLTNISVQSLGRLMQTYRESGGVTRPAVCAGRPRVLDGLDANVSQQDYEYTAYVNAVLVSGGLFRTAA